MAAHGRRRSLPALAALWLLLALLPLRGWAGVAMHLPDAAAHEVAVAPACHGAAPEGHDHGGPADDATAHADAACTLCDLCHGAVAPQALPPQPAGHAAAQRPPVTSPGAPPEGVATTLYRPPRR